MSKSAPVTQRAMMRQLYRIHSGDETAICAAYVLAEAEGLVHRKSNDYGQSAESYAKALFRVGVHRGWICEKPEGIAA